MLNKEEIRKAAYEYIDACLESNVFKRASSLWFSATFSDSCHKTIGITASATLDVLKQPQIKIGDIYKNAAGDLVYIFKSTKLLDDFADVFYGQVIGYGIQYRYDSMGRAELGADLCLDKKYEIKEIEND